MEEVLKSTHCTKINTFGEYLCAEDLSRRVKGLYEVRQVYLGLGRGEALAISGLKRHGRIELLQILSGYKIPCKGNVWAMSKWNLSRNPFKYSRLVSLSCEYPSLPSWLTLRESLELIASLRGVPPNHVKQEVQNFIEALELSSQANKRISEFSLYELTPAHFAAAVIGAPPIIVVDEVTAWQKFSVRRAIYNILYNLRKKGHAVVTAATNIEKHLPVTSRRLAFMIDGAIYDIDSVEKLVDRYSPEGVTVVVHLKDEVDVLAMFQKYFEDCCINDVSEVFVNVQIKDQNISWKTIIERMETLQLEHGQVLSYIITSTAIDYVYNSCQSRERGLREATGFITWNLAKKIISSKPKTMPTKEDLDQLKPFEKKYDITTLKQLPWSVVFQTDV